MIPSEPIATSIKKMIPIWGILLILVLGSLLTIHLRAASYLESGVYSAGQLTALAEIQYYSGEKIWLKFAEKAAEGDNEELEGKLGEFKNDPEIDIAIEKFETAISLNPSLYIAHRKIAQLEFWKGNEAASFYHLGQKYLKEKQYSIAEIHLGTAQDLKPENINYLVQYGNALAFQQRWDDIDEILTNAPEDFFEDRDAILLAAKKAHAVYDFNQAIPLLDKLIERIPVAEEAAELYINVYAGRDDDIEKLGKLLEKLIESKSISARSFHRIAVDLTDSDDYENALISIDEALKIQPNNVIILVDKTLILKQLDRNFEAQRVYDKALTIDFNLVTNLIQSEVYQPLDEL